MSTWWPTDPKFNMLRKSKRPVTNSNLDVPLEDKVEAIFIKFITVKGYSTSEASFRTLAFFRDTEPKFDSRAVSKFISKIIDGVLWNLIPLSLKNSYSLRGFKALSLNSFLVTAMVIKIQKIPSSPKPRNNHLFPSHSCLLQCRRYRVVYKRSPLWPLTGHPAYAQWCYLRFLWTKLEYLLFFAFKTSKLILKFWF